MNNNIFLSKEENLLIDILFSEKKLNKTQFKFIDYELLIKIASSHLMLPSLYVNLKKKKQLKLIPDELVRYLKEIYEINSNRNKVLIQEIQEISEFLNTNKINYVFLKGSSMILGDYFDDVGERMLGDIDILIDYKQRNKVINLLNENSYEANFTYKVWNANVDPSFTNTKKLFSIDLHNKLMPKKYNYLIDSSTVLNKSLKIKKNINILNAYDELAYSIYNYQIGDHGYLKVSYSYRKIYDIFRILKKNKIYQLKKDKFILNFFNTIKELNIISEISFEKSSNRLFNERFKLKINNKYYRFLDNSICRLVIVTENLHLKLLEFMFNRKYRKRAINKMIN